MKTIRRITTSPTASMETNMHINKKLSAAFLFAVLVGVGYLGVQYFNPQLFADRGDYNTQNVEPPGVDAAIIAESKKPRFSGEVLGIFLAPKGTPIPEKYSQSKIICTEHKAWTVPDDQAGVLTLNLELPEQYVLDTESPNTGTVACDGGVTVSRKSYTYALPNDTAYVIVGRSYLRYDEQSFATNRVRAEKIAGRDVVIVDTITEGSFWDHSYAYFPEPFGVTFIQTASLPRSEFMKLVQLVASSTRTQ